VLLSQYNTSREKSTFCLLGINAEVCSGVLPHSSRRRASTSSGVMAGCRGRQDRHGETDLREAGIGSRPASLALHRIPDVVFEFLRPEGTGKFEIRMPRLEVVFPAPYVERFQSEFSPHRRWYPRGLIVRFLLQPLFVT